MSFKEFQEGRRGSHLECRNGTILAVLNLHVSPMPLIKFQLNPTYRSGADVISRFSSWPSWWPFLGYWNGTILAILNLHVTQMPPTKFGLNLTYCSGADVVGRFSRWPPLQPSWILEWKDFSNSESLCCSNASHQVSAQSD